MNVVLQRIYEALGGASWLVSEGWEPGLSCDVRAQDQWHGTECAGDTIVRLELVANGLRGTIPTQIGAMPALTSLAIESNSLLSGTIPTEIGALHALRSLSIHNNTRISGTIPAQLADLQVLRFLSLHSSSLSGTLPSSELLRRLSYFDASSNDIGGHMTSFDGLSTLAYLNLHDNLLSGTLGDSVGTLTNLRDRLYVHSNRISGSLPPSLGNLTQVALPALQENRISGVLPTELGRITELAFPSLAYNMISGTIPTELSAWTSLEGRLDLLSNFAERQRYAEPRGELPYLRNNPVLTEQGHIDLAIVRKTLFAPRPTSFYAHYDRCDWRQEPAGRFQCSVSGYSGTPGRSASAPEEVQPLVLRFRKRG